MKAIYTAIAKHLSEECPFLRLIDIDRGQLNTLYAESSRPMVTFPCLLIRISTRRALDITPYEQECTTTITLYTTATFGNHPLLVQSPTLSLPLLSEELICRAFSLMALLPFDCVSDSAVSVVTLLPTAGSVKSVLFFLSILA